VTCFSDDITVYVPYVHLVKLNYFIIFHLLLLFIIYYFIIFIISFLLFFVHLVKLNYFIIFSSYVMLYRHGEIKMNTNAAKNSPKRMARPQGQYWIE